MIIAKVVGTVIATQKNRSFKGAKLLICDTALPDGTLTGAEVVAVDTVGAGIGDYVIVVSEGNSSRQAMRSKDAPVDSAIVAIIDRVDTEGMSFKVL